MVLVLRFMQLHSGFQGVTPYFNDVSFQLDRGNVVACLSHIPRRILFLAMMQSLLLCYVDWFGLVCLKF